MRSRYPAHIAVAALALLRRGGGDARAIPYAFKLMIDSGFAGGAGADGDIARWFQYLLMLVVVMAVATALRFYFVSLARRAHRRRHPPRGAAQPAAPRARLLRGKPPVRNRLAA